MDKFQEDNIISFLFREIIKQYHNIMRKKLNELGLYRGQPHILFALCERDGRTNKELAETLEIQPATVTKMIKRMEKNEFVTKRQDNLDMRVTRVYITEHGKIIKVEVEKIYRDIHCLLLKNFSVEDKLLMKKLLKKIKDNLYNIDLIE